MNSNNVDGDADYEDQEEQNSRQSSSSQSHNKWGLGYRKYSRITPEMKDKLIFLIVRSNMSIKQVSHFLFRLLNTLKSTTPLPSSSLANTEIRTSRLISHLARTPWCVFSGSELKTKMTTSSWNTLWAESTKERPLNSWMLIKFTQKTIEVKWKIWFHIYHQILT